MEAEIATQAIGLTSSTDFSLINLFLRADIVVKSVIIILILASIYSWSLIFDKYRLFKRIHKSSSVFEDKFWNSKSAESFYNTLPNKTMDPIANIFRSAMVELIRSKAPFIGLFGTVWGIMNSFQSIAISRNTSLAIVAPGIAEALFATALGLLAAVPAVVAYNKFNNESRIYGRRIENFTKKFLSII
jgi:biopolymer transport protein TolQ